MRELQLNINKAFYTAICLFALGIAMIGNLLGSFLNLTFNHLELVISIGMVMLCCLYLGLSLSGLRQVTFCSQGIFYINLYGKKRYVLAEHVEEVKVVSFLGFKATRVKLYNSTLLFVAFNPCKKQALRLKNFGYSIA